MSEYSWLLEHKETYAYNYEYFSKGIIGYPVVIEGAVTEKNKIVGVSFSWSYEDRGKLFKYTGVGRIRERNYYCLSKRTDDLEMALAIFPLPSNYKLDMLWGVAVGTTGGFPAAFRVLWTGQNISIAQAKKEFDKAKAAEQESFIVMDYNPDDLGLSNGNMTQKREEKIIEFNQQAYEDNFFKILEKDLEKK